MCRVEDGVEFGAIESESFSQECTADPGAGARRADACGAYAYLYLISDFTSAQSRRHRM